MLKDDNAGNDNWQGLSTQGVYMSATSDVHPACAESISLDGNLIISIYSKLPGVW